MTLSGFKEKPLEDLLSAMSAGSYIKVGTTNGGHFVYGGNVQKLLTDLPGINSEYYEKLVRERNRKIQTIERLKEKYKNDPRGYKAFVGKEEKRMANLIKSIEDFVPFEKRRIDDVFIAASVVDDVDAPVLTVYVAGHENGNVEWIMADGRGDKSRKR